MKKDRIEWIDYYKAIAISLMVIGHITGVYNKYIYQFHMAAFFFISGYCFSFNKSKIRILWEKVYSLIWPLLFVFCIGAISMSILDACGIYDEIWGEYSYIGLKDTFIQFFLNNSNYVWWMGACWFISVLFGINVLVLAMAKVTNYSGRYQHVILLLLSLALYVMGINMAKNGTCKFDFDLVCIGQLYFVIGFLIRKSGYTMTYNKFLWKNVLTLLLTSFVMYLGGHIQNITVDYPSRFFNYYFLSVLFALNGIAWIYCIAQIIDRALLKSVILKRAFLFVGKNTLSILFFHFLFFKFAFWILSVFGIVDKEYIKKLIPKEPVGSKYMLLFLVIAICGSVILWNILTKFRIINILLGQDRDFREKAYSLVADSIKNTKIYKSCGAKGNDVSYIESWRSFFTKNKFLVIISIIFCTITFLPLVRQGVILNDEIKLRLYRMSGITNIIKTGIKIELDMGRPLRFMAGINETLSFLTENMYINKIVQIGIILLGIVLFSVFLYKLFLDTKIAFLAGVLVALFLPITFEHAVPNAFVGLTVLPIVCLLLSLIFWCDYLEGEKRKDFIWAIFFWIIALLGYEYMVTYTPLFLVIYLAKRKKKSFLDFIKKCIVPGGAGFAYLIGIFALQKISGDKYSGVTISFVSLDSSFEIIRNLVRSAFPGYFFSNDKYRYILYMLTGENYPIILEKGVHLYKNLTFWEFVRNELLNWRIIVLITISVAFLFLILKNKGNKKKDWKNVFFTCVVAVVYLIIPVMPNAISKLYQGNVTESNFTSLPVSFCVTLTICMLLAYVASWFIDLTKGNKLCMAALIAIIVVWSIPVQGMNDIISREQERNYKRLQDIEDVLSTDCVKNMNGSTIYTKDLFDTYNALSIHDSYWNDYLRTKGLNMQVGIAEGSEYAIYLIDNTYFCMSGEYETVILTKEKLSDAVKIQISQDEYLLSEPGMYYVDNGYFVYRFNNNNYLALNDGARAFEVEYKIIGTSIGTANIISGIYEDGWVQSEAVLEISGGESGKMVLSGYYPNELQEDTHIVIRANGEEVMYSQITDNLFVLQFDIMPNEISMLEISTNMQVIPDNGDIRELGFILQGLQEMEQ